MLTLEGNNGQRTQLLARDHVFELATRARIAAQARARETWLPSAPTHSLPGAARQAGRQAGGRQAALARGHVRLH